ncbi:RIP metalloprotease [Chloroflexota bacterium]
MLIAFLSFVVVLMVVVLAHEAGHFFTARAFGVKVLEFGIGFPPRLISFMRKGTRYSLNAIPLGGFVKMAGEEDPDVEGSLASKRPLPRIIVLAAGSAMNFLLPVLLFSIAFIVPHQVFSGEVVIEAVGQGSPAAIAGIEPGDKVVAINGLEMNNNQDVQRQVLLYLGKPMTLTMLKNGGAEAAVSLTPRWRPPEGEGATGITIATQNGQVNEVSVPFWDAIPRGIGECIDTYVLFKNVIISMFIGTVPVVLSGPVGIAQISGEAARAGLSSLLEFTAFFSVNLAIINIFPLPALDGGRIVFVLLEWVGRGRRVSPRAEGLIHMAGFVLLMGVALLITYQDILRIIAGEALGQ